MTPEDIARLYQAALDSGADPERVAEARKAALAEVHGDIEALARAWTTRQLLDDFIAELRPERWPAVQWSPFGDLSPQPVRPPGPTRSEKATSH